MTKHHILLLLLLLLAVLGLALPAECEAPPASTDPAAITVAMEDCKTSRLGTVTSHTILRLLVAGPPREELVKRGTVTLDGKNYTLYLPKAKAYSIKNSKPKDGDFENTSTLISVDPNGDGRLTAAEGWFANLPVRLGDSMFDVTEIAADGSRIVLKPSKAPLRGVIVGRSCPPFSFKTADGKEVSRDRLAGKPFLLDIWSIT
jgi:hypothetical protein